MKVIVPLDELADKVNAMREDECDFVKIEIKEEQYSNTVGLHGISTEELWERAYGEIEGQLD